jgi:CRISPR-associated endonuclease Cas1
MNTQSTQRAYWQNDDDTTWADRNEFWLRRSLKTRAYRRPRERPREPLVLTGHGVSLRIEHGALVVRNGFTHHPQEREVFRYFKGDVRLPPRIIVLDGSGGLSFDVVNWLAEQNVALFRINYLGEVVSIIGGSGAAYDSEQVRWQLETRADPQRRLDFCCELIASKIGASAHTLRTALPDSGARQVALKKASASIQRLRGRAVRTVNDVLLTEAGAAATYFAAWRGLPLRWRRRARSPIPSAWEFAEGRASKREAGGPINRHATHPMNAMLNYAYAVLHSQVQREAINEGFDPRLGIMHETRTGGQALVLDLMEARRPAIDAHVLKFASSELLSFEDFVIRKDGVCRLAPQLARRLCASVPA